MVRRLRSVVARLRRVDAPFGANTRRLLFTPTGAGKHDLVEITVPATSGVVGRRIVDLGFPPEALILLIHREGESIVPNGSAVLEAGDEI